MMMMITASIGYYYIQGYTLVVFEVPPVLHPLYLQFLFTYAPLSLNDVVHSSVDVTQLCFYANNCGFVTTVKLTNDERCSIHNLRVVKR